MRLVFGVGCEGVGSEGCFFGVGCEGWDWRDVSLGWGVRDGVGGMFLLYPSIVIIFILVFYRFKLSSACGVSLWGRVWGWGVKGGIRGMFLLYPSIVIIFIPVSYRLKLISNYEVSL